MNQKNNSLYELSNQLARITEIVISEEGIISENMEKELDNILPLITDRAGNIGKWVRNIDGNIEAIESEINRLKRRKEVNDHLKERLKTYLKDSMEKAGMDKIDTGIMVLSIQRNPPTVAILDEKEIPVEYEILTIVKTIDKKHLLEDLKAGKAISGAELRQGSHLRLK